MTDANTPLMDRLVASPACVPQWTLEEILPAYAELGFRNFEAFTSWCKSALNFDHDPSHYRELAQRHGLRITSMHLPPVKDDLETTLPQAVRAAAFAQALGAEVVLFKADTQENYIRAARPFLDALQPQQIAVTPVLQNHRGSAISTLDDFSRVLRGVNDPRMKTLLEVGHFQRVGTAWREACDLLGDSIALVHINEIKDAQSVPYGEGEVDFAGLFAHLRAVNYTGRIVVELELSTRDADPQRTLTCLRQGLAYLAGCMG